MDDLINISASYEFYQTQRIIDVPDNYGRFVYCLFFVLIVIGNIWVIVAVFRQPKLRNSSTNMFIISLSLADLLVAMFQIPHELFYYHVPRLFDSLNSSIFFCRTFAWLQWTSRCASVFSLVGIAIDRYRAIVTPLEPKLTRSHAAGIISVVWIASLGYSARKPALLDVVPFTWYNVTILACYVPYGWKAELSRLFHLVDFLVMYLIPLIIMTGLYIAMIVSLRKKGPTNLSNRNKRKAIKMLMLVVLSFALSWLPHYILLLYWNFTDYEDIPMGMKKGAWVMRHIEAFSYNSNSWTNPCLYAYFNENFRKEFYRMFPCLEKCLKGNKIVPKTSKSSQEPNTLQTRATVQEPNAINLNQK